jgi:hypothetical protein
METSSLVIYHSDPRKAQALAVSLSKHFEPVKLVRKYEEVSPAILRLHAEVLVLDLETSQADAVRRLHREFPSLCIVATHRLADDGVWTEAMTQGASDVCEPRNEQVVESVMRERRNFAAAAA